MLCFTSILYYVQVVWRWLGLVLLYIFKLSFLLPLRKIQFRKLDVHAPDSTVGNVEKMLRDSLKSTWDTKLNADFADSRHDSARWFDIVLR